MKKKKKDKELQNELKKEIQKSKVLCDDLQGIIQDLNDKKIEYKILIKQLKTLKENIT